MNNYRNQTPQIVSILYRKLKPGQTFEDFQKAHLPPGECRKAEFGYDVDYFNVPTRVINAVCATDPTMIISIGLTYGGLDEFLHEVAEKLPLEIERARKISEVSEKIGATEVYLTASDNNYGKSDAHSKQIPLTKVTTEVITIVTNAMSGLKK